MWIIEMLSQHDNIKKSMLNTSWRDLGWSVLFDPEDGDNFIGCTCGITCTMYNITVLVQSIVVKFEYPIVTVITTGYNIMLCSRR